MNYYEVAPTKIVRSGADVFTYHSEGQLAIGEIVSIQVGHRTLAGVVMQTATQPDYATKPIDMATGQILPQPLLRLARWIADYYATPLALVLQTLLPRGVLKQRRNRTKNASSPVRDRAQIVLNPEQSSAITTIQSASSGSILLHGITGSGKTAVYKELAEETLKQGASVIVLVPEIALTPQLVDEFSSTFSDVILTHSRQTEAERHHVWTEALSSSLPRVVIGPRSALFMPLQNVGLIVIDESHEPSFKQEQSPRYSALRAASMLARYHDARLVLGSATPLVSDYYVAKQTERPIVEMKTTARPAKRSAIGVVDMTKRDNFHRHRFLSDQLLGAIETSLAANEQSLIFHNRRGSASTTLCENCGWQALCSRCFIPLTLHSDKHQLSCHICGQTEKVPTSCPVCQHASIIHKGIGTKLIQSEIERLFPKAKVARFDGDTDEDGSVDARYKELYDGSIDIIIGTQVIAKGLDLPHLRTVGVIQADAGLSLPDYSSPERTFQLLAQVIGRVGRSDHDTSVVVQTYQPKHPAIVDGLSRDYASFYDATIAERKRAHFPPFVFLLKLTCIYKTEAATIRNAQALARTLRKNLRDVEILGPTPLFYERRADTYRWQLVLKSKQRSNLIAALEYLPATHWQFELDPQSLL